MTNFEQPSKPSKALAMGSGKLATLVQLAKSGEIAGVQVGRTWVDLTPIKDACTS